MHGARPRAGRHAGHADGPLGGSALRAASSTADRLRPLAGRLGRRPGARSWWDVVWVAWLAWIFDAINNLGAVRQRLAEHHGQDVLSLERALHLAPELALNTWLAGQRRLTEVVVVFYYVNIHAAVTFALIAWLWWRRPDLLPPLRAAMIAVNLAALAVFWSWPVAPPRMLARPRFVDLVALVAGASPHWRPGSIAVYANQLSALPSLHVAWAVWSAVVVWRLSHRRSVRAAAAIYPVLTGLAVMATANHYLTDAVTGALLAGLAVAAADRLTGRDDQARLRAGRRAPGPPDRTAATASTMPGRRAP